MSIAYASPGRGRVRRTLFAHDKFRVCIWPLIDDGARTGPQERVDTETADEKKTEWAPITLILEGALGAHVNTSPGEPSQRGYEQCFISRIQLEDGASARQVFVPARWVEIDPMHPPAAAAPAPPAAAAPATPTLLQAAQPTAVVLAEMFEPIATDAAAFVAECKTQLPLNNWDSAPMPQRVQQVLNNVNADFRARLITPGALGLDIDDVYARIKLQRHGGKSGAELRAEISRRHASNTDNAGTFAGRMITDFIKSYHCSTSTQLHAKLQTAGRREGVYQTLGVYLLDSLAPAAGGAPRLQKGALIEKCKPFEAVEEIEKLINDEYRVRSKATGKSLTGTGSLFVGEDKQQVQALLARIEALEKNQGKKSPQQRDGKLPDRYPDCSLCANDPQPVEGAPPGRHWQSHCPRK